MITYVWAVSEDNAIEKAFDCHDYKDLVEAYRKEPIQNGRPVYELFQLEVKRVDHQR